MSTETTKPNYFDRQTRIPDWNQKAIEDQVCLCLGSGGLGCTVALNLARLGVKKIFLVDKDTVDEHNLNRQILFKKNDIGKSKVECAVRALKEEHNLRSEIIGYHIDVLERWDVVVDLAKQSTIIFNMIDVGEYLDLAVQALARKFGIPFCLGGTFRTTLTVDFYKPTGACYACVSDHSNKEVRKELVPSKIADFKDLKFIPKDDNPTGASNVYVCCTCCNFMTSAFSQHLMGFDVPTRLIFYYLTYDIDKWNMEPDSKCTICNDMKQ